MLPTVITGSLKGTFVPLVARLGLKRTSASLRKLACWIDFSSWCRENSGQNSLDFSQTYDSQRRYMLYEKVVKTEGLQHAPVDYLEFGVYKGNSLRWWLKSIETPESKFVGFDCFTGLPEQWRDRAVGTFHTEGKPPEIFDERCSFEIGLFQDTLPKFLLRFDASKRIVVNMDADLYSSTMFVLSTLAAKLKPGDIIFFDEFSSAADEFCAFQEYISCFHVQYELLGHVNNFNQVAIKLIS